MRFAKFVIVTLAAIFGVCLCSLRASEDIIILEQDYSIVETSKGKGVEAKDTRQVLYITRDIVAIDEFGDNGATPTETFLVDMKFQRIVNIDHTEKKILLDESFADRRNQIHQRMKHVQSDIDGLDPGAGKSRLAKMYLTMLDGAREFGVEEVPGEKEIAGVKCKTVKLVDMKDPYYPTATLALHPDMDMPYDNSEVLFLMKIAGEKMAQFLKSKQSVFSRVPMAMHLQTAEGGTLDTKVVKVTKMKLDAFDPKTRPLGNPFATPEGYSIVRKLTAKPVESKDKPKEKAD